MKKIFQMINDVKSSDWGDCYVDGYSLNIDEILTKYGYEFLKAEDLEGIFGGKLKIDVIKEPVTFENGLPKNWDDENI